MPCADMPNVSDEELEVIEKLHAVSFKMLLDLDRVCKANDIQYVISDGTLLGAVRHKDFIPWDDDADVSMTRENYDKFCKVADQMGPHYTLFRPELRTDEFWDHVTHLRYDLVQVPDGAYDLDIFILDRAPASETALFPFRLKVLWGMSMSKRRNIDYSKYDSFVGKAEAFLLSLLGRPFSLEKLNRMYVKSASKYNDDPNATKMCQSTAIPCDWGAKSYEASWYDEPIEIELHGHMFPAASNPTGPLSAMYGDFMSFPRPESRVPKHIHGMADQVKFLDEA